MDISPETLAFITQHKDEKPADLALKSKKYPLVDIQYAITQIAGRQVIKDKVPAFYTTEGIIYPKHLSLEQCSSELTAGYKAGLLKGDSLIDLTGGFGIDCTFLAKNFKEVTYIERQTELCDIATNNFRTLGLSHITIKNGDGIEYLKETEKVDCIFIDPARRDKHGGKTISISDCEPDIKEIASLLTDKADTIMVKLSPMLDLARALNELPTTSEVHVISVDNECKELLLILRKDSVVEKNIYCINLHKNGEMDRFDFSREDEQNMVCYYTPDAEQYLYEPNASIIKAGAYKTISSYYKIKKLHPNSHLYTSPERVENFPGRVFKVISCFSLNKKEMKEKLGGILKANITIRNFPSTVEELRKRMKLKDGGEDYLFATTLANEKKIIIHCKKA